MITSMHYEQKRFQKLPFFEAHLITHFDQLCWVLWHHALLGKWDLADENRP
jgi:hypothetical protein